MTKICKIIKLFCGQNWLSSVSNECYNLLVFYDRYVDPFKIEVINKDNKDEYEEILDIAKNIDHKMINTEPFCIRSYPTITKSCIYLAYTSYTPCILSVYTLYTPCIQLSV